ncbi:MAG: hypothetical protein JXA95_01905, partial [Spirochaetales bacterium]|nr:hypothetical protein [Spirochaetales bacterium]
MVNPIFLIVIALGAAFLLGLFRKASDGVRFGLTFLALAGMTLISAAWAYGILSGGTEGVQIFTAGFKPPLSINLYLGRAESVLLLLVNLTALLSLIFLRKEVRDTSVYMLMLLMVFVMGLNGVIMTRDLFNLFVFIEIVSIASAGLIPLRSDVKQLSAGFKFVIAGALASGFMLIGIIFVYYSTGSLNLDVIAAAMSPALATAGFAGIFLVFIGIVMELKPFPVNGWGLDVYEASLPPVAAMVAAGTASAMFYAFTKVMAITAGRFLGATIVIGGLTFVGMNILALKQEKSQRLLGYSSISQIGLLVMAYGLLSKTGAAHAETILFGLLITHALAKAGLFWLAGIVGKENIKEWSLIRRNPAALLAMIMGIFALTAFPPFPSFFAKWELIMALAGIGGFGYIAVILVGSFLEAIYLFRWLGYALKLDYDKEVPFDSSALSALPSLLFGLVLIVLGYFMGTGYGIPWLPLAAVFAFLILDRFDSRIKTTLALILIGAYGYLNYQSYLGDLFKVIFAGVFIGGAFLTTLSGYYYKGRRAGFHASTMSMFFGLFMLLSAQTMIQFFYAWEFMAIGSYFLLIRGKKSMPHGYSYLMFSIGGSFAMLMGFAMAYLSSGSLGMDAITHITVFPAVAYSLMLIGFMTKTATMGFHIWLPGAHGEAVADIHFMASAILLKAGVLGIIYVLLGMDLSAGYSHWILLALGWLGILSSLIGNVNAAFQESAKRLLAWSSIGQLGYIVFGLSTMSHMGWLIALSLSITHFLYKGILFLIIGGISLKLGTPMMYKMGGLIRRMPLSFLAVLIAIITLSGIPPLVGFTAKWILYNVTVGNGLYFQGVIASFAGLVAFLYLFRLIFSIFLGQLKDEHRRVGEINVWFLIPVYLLIGYIMVVSFLPGTLLGPIGDKLMAFFPDNPIVWKGYLATSELGYFNGTMIMNVFMTLFVVNFLIL